jgi:hypothetical protein
MKMGWPTWSLQLESRKKLLKRLDDDELSEDTDTEIEKSEESRKYRDKNAGNADGFDSACELDDQCSARTSDRKGKKRVSLTQRSVFSEKHSQAMSLADSGYDSYFMEGEKVSLLFQCFSTVDLLVQRPPALSQPA